jgi:hypothetical protein
MAAAAKKVQLTVTQKTLLGGGLAIYEGTAEGGTGYETGGVTLEEEATNSRYKLPEKWVYFTVQGGLLAQWVAAAQKLKLLAVNTVTAKKSGFVEYENGETMATLLPAGTPFFGIGLA